MPIRFQCPTCEGTLSIAKRKAGTQVLCPKCEEIITVPAEESDVELAEEATEASSANPLAVAKPRPIKPKSSEDRPLFEGTNIEELLETTKEDAAPAVARRSAPLPLPPQPTPTPTSEDGILVSREVAIILGVVMAVLLGLSFITGYFIGS